MTILNSENVGIILMAYSRPKHVKQVLEGLKNSKIGRFTVFMDGADDHIIREKQSEIRSILKEVDWAEIQFVQRSVNLGLRRSIISAVTEHLKMYEQIILLEDDCVPLPGFFNFMFQALSIYKQNQNIRSICGYQFPINFGCLTEEVSAIGLSRFVPWGWATWRDRWHDYNTDLRELTATIKDQELLKTLPLDIQRYCEREDFLNDNNDIWSLNWVLEHYLSRTFAVFPSRTLISNIGFDGTGVHCFDTDVFEIEPYIVSNVPKISLSSDVATDHLIDLKITTYMDRHWEQTMIPQNLVVNGPLLEWQVGGIVRDVVEKTSIIDIHTHLFPPNFQDCFLSGPDELLTYHYLTVEALTLTGIKPYRFFKMEKVEQAAFVWDRLFRNQTPLSEAAQGVVTLLEQLNIPRGPRPYEEVRADIMDALPTAEDVMKIANIRRICMTNDPFQFNEWKLFDDMTWDRFRFISALRMDRLFTEYDKTVEKIRAQGFELRNDLNAGIDLQAFLDFVGEKAMPSYLALSVDGNQLQSWASSLLMVKGIIPWLKKNNLPLALMIGVRRGVNPTYGAGGDGIGCDGLASLEGLLKSNPDLTIMATHLCQNDQFNITVLSRKFPNLKLFGFWWFLNQPGLISDILGLRLDLLGTNFIAQHSDARIMEQLLYKWIHFKRILTDTLTVRYRKLIVSGWPVDLNMIERDVKALLYDNSNAILSKPN